jgi:hypothetical protein
VKWAIVWSVEVWECGGLSDDLSDKLSDELSVCRSVFLSEKWDNSTSYKLLLSDHHCRWKHISLATSCQDWHVH